MATTDAPLMQPGGELNRHGKPHANARSAKPAVICLSFFFGLLCLFGALYILASELAMPRSFWLKEYRLFNPSGVASEYSVGPLGSQIAQWLPEAGVFARYADCEEARLRAMTAEDWGLAEESRLTCIKAIEEALQAAPASTALWFHRARLLAQLGGREAAAADSLRMSYATGAREGWIMASRLTLALRMWEQLPEDLHIRAGEEVRSMAKSWSQIQTLSYLYWSNPPVRDRLAELVEQQATAEQKNQFAGLVKQLMKGNRAR